MEEAKCVSVDLLFYLKMLLDSLLSHTHTHTHTHTHKQLVHTMSINVIDFRHKQ